MKIDYGIGRTTVGNLKPGQVFCVEDIMFYIVTDAETADNVCVCVDLDNGHMFNFNKDEEVQFVNAELWHDM